MNVRQVLPGVAAGAAIGVLMFLLRMTQSVDGDLHLERLAYIRAVNSLDVQLNRTVTQARVTSMADSADGRAQVVRQLGEALNAMEQGPRSLRGLAPELDQALTTFLDTIETKFELSWDFEARSIQLNQRMLHSLDSIPVVSEQVMAVAPAALHESLRELLGRLNAETVSFAVTPTPTNGPIIQQLVDELAKIGETQSPEFKDALLLLRSRAEEVLADKAELVEKFDTFLNRPTDTQLQAVEQAYITWHESQVGLANRYRLALVAYAATLLIVLGWLGLRLRRSYRELDRANDDLSHANENLEGQVQERTKDLSRALQDLRSSQAQLIQSEKMASLGQMVAGVAHEINTPLGYARSNTEIVRSSLAEIRDLHTAMDKALRLLTSEQASNEEIANALAEAQARREAIHAEELVGDLVNLLADTDHGLSQIGDLVASLKDFSRLDRSRNDLFNVNDGLDSALKIAHNQLKHRVEVVKQYGPVPQIECSPSQLNQVFLNLLTNAAQAIDGKGKVYVHTSPETDGVAIRIVDTGCGMSDEVRARIFEPFFTTKPVGKGTGLGLSIVYRIIEDHGGHVEVRSAPGKGSAFTIHLPLKQTQQAAAVAEPTPALAAA